jgi:O-antigen ligase
MPRALLLALIAGSLAAFGGIYRWATLPILLGAAAVLLASLNTLRFPRHQRTLDIALAVAAVLVALQLVPVPRSARDLVSPHAERVTGAVQLATRPGAARPLSIDPPATIHGLATYAAAVLVFWAARGILTHGGVRSLSRGVAWIGGVMAVAALFYQAASPRLIYGFWEPGAAGATPFGPFINRNQFAAWLILALPIATGHFVAHVRIHWPDLARAPQRWRAIARTGGWTELVAIIVMLLAIVTSLSRSAVAGLVVGTAVAWRLSRARLAGTTAAPLLLVGVATVGALIVLVAIDPEQLGSRVTSTLQQSGTNRLTIWRETLPMIRDFWLTGVGVGAYGVGMLVYQQTQVSMAHLQPGGWAHFNQAHSHYLQVAAEGGLLVSIAVMIALVAFAVSVRRALASHAGEIEWIRIGAVAALIAVAVQSVWETALRMPANAVLCALVAAIAVHHREHRTR